ncbi:MAG: hypothetical protein GYA43_07910 [Bacteroidales bacterium]|nr:hypothetical protein [Bacteroidales bacterium]
MDYYNADTGRNIEINKPCHSLKIPLWLVLPDNIPSALLFVLGFLIIIKLSVSGAVLYAIYSPGTIVWFRAGICPYCHHFGTYSCPCGYGIISSALYKRRDTDSFQKVFKKNIPVLFPDWFAPPLFAAYLLLMEFSMKTLILAIGFSLTGFMIIPLISEFAGFRNCGIRRIARG